MILAVSKDALCFVKQRENQIVLTIGALLHYTDVDLLIRSSCLLFSVSSVLFRDNRRSIKEQNAMKSHNKKNIGTMSN